MRKKSSTHDSVHSLRALILFMGAFVALLAGSAVPAVAATVSAQPNVPASALPSDGVQIEYGDGFGAQLTQFGGTDNTWFPNKDPLKGCVTQAGRHGNEMQNFTCNQVTVDPTVGMILTCSYGAPPNKIQPGVAINYACGEANSNPRSAPSGYNMFGWQDVAYTNRAVVQEIKFQFPPNYGSDPGWWGTGTYSGTGNNGDEIDNMEGFGWTQAANGTDCLNGNACAQTWQKQNITFPTMVRGTGSPHNENVTGASLGFNPAAAFHTYDVVYRGDTSTVSSYVDGKLIAYFWPSRGATFLPLGGRTGNSEVQDLKLTYAMRGGLSVNGVTLQDPVPTFNQPGQSHQMTIRSIAIYENTNANHAGMTSNSGTLPLIAPGTTVN